MDVVVPFIVFAILGSAVCVFAGRVSTSSETSRLTRLLILAFVLRLVAATIFALVPSTRIFHDDSDGYEWVGMRIADGWRGTGPPMDMMTGRDQNYGYFYVCGSLYYVFGAFRPVVSYVNCVLGTVSISLVYRLASRFFDRIVAMRAAVLVAFVPSMILWSAMALKDTLMSFCILVCLVGCVSLREKTTPSAIALVLLSLVAVQPIRFYLVYFLFFAVVSSLALDSVVKRNVGRFYKPLLLGGGFVALLAVAGLSSRLQQGMEFLDLHRVSTFRHDMASTAQSGFSANVDVSSPIGAISFLPIGVATLLLSPFPWQFTSIRALFALPEMLIWWALIPSFVRGVVFAVKNRGAAVAPLVIFGGTLTMAYSLVHGNVGSGFRQRAQIFILLFIFTALGWYQRKCRRAGIDERLLLRPEPTT